MHFRLDCKGSSIGEPEPPDIIRTTLESPNGFTFEVLLLGSAMDMLDDFGHDLTPG